MLRPSPNHGTQRLPNDDDDDDDNNIDSMTSAMFWRFTDRALSVCIK